MQLTSSAGDCSVHQPDTQVYAPFVRMNDRVTELNITTCCLHRSSRKTVFFRRFTLTGHFWRLSGASWLRCIKMKSASFTLAPPGVRCWDGHCSCKSWLHSLGRNRRHGYRLFSVIAGGIRAMSWTIEGADRSFEACQTPNELDNLMTRQSCEGCTFRLSPASVAIDGPDLHIFLRKKSMILSSQRCLSHFS